MGLNFVLNNTFSYKLVGFLNKRFGLIKTVFVAYPATEEYALSYVYPWYRHKMRWSPWPVGIFEQNGRWGLMTVISSTEKDFVETISTENLKDLMKRTEKICSLINAEQVTYAGILPGVFYKKGLSNSTIEATVTVEAVTKAEKSLRELINYPVKTPLIILGAKGYIGSRLVTYYGNRATAADG